MPASSDTTADLVTDIVIPTVIVIALFVINGLIFAIIMKHRKRIVYETPEDYALAAGATCSNVIELEQL